MKKGRVVRKVWIDLDRDAYCGFFDHEWAKQLDRNTRHHPDLSRAVEELGLAWKCNSNAFRYPWLMPDFHERFVIGFFQDDEPMSIGFVQLLKRKLAERARESV
jgi:hypothetical protein